MSVYTFFAVVGAIAMLLVAVALLLLVGDLCITWRHDRERERREWERHER